MKKPLFITIIILLLTGGFFLYNYLYNHPEVDKWDLVPQQTVLVYETSDCKDCLDQLNTSPLVALIQKAVFTEHENDTLNSIQKFILSFQQPTLVSLHQTKKDEFDFGYYVNHSPNFQQKISFILDQIAKVKGVKSVKREFNGVEISEIEIKGRTFSWIVIEKVWAGSFSAIIVEDIIRTYLSEEKPSFKTVVNTIYQLPRIKNDGGNLYIHLRNLSSLFSLFTGKPSGFLINNFGHSALLDTKVEEKKLVLNGFSYHPTDNKEYFLSAFAEQSPVEFQLKSLVSNRTLMLTEFGISDGEKFYKRLTQLSKSPFTDSLRTIQERTNKDLAELYKGFSGEIGVCLLESRKEIITKILLLRDQKNPQGWLELFNSVSETFARDSIVIDEYAGYRIFETQAAGLPDKLFYPLVSGFENSYYVQVGNTLCVGENVEELKRFLDDIDQENTWGKSVAQNKFLESTLIESNVGIFVNTPRIWNLLISNLQPKWQQFVEENKLLRDKMGMGAIQFSHLNDTYYTNVSWSFKEAKTKEEQPVQSDSYVTNFQHGISNFSIVKSHVDNSTAVLVQDSSKTLHYLSDEGKIQWQVRLDGYITEPAKQIDFLGNGKLQYFFATPGSLHVVDRLGNYVKPFPVSIKEQQIEHVSVVDYDHSKKYRFLISSQEGKLWMFDKGGENLEGWQPRTVDEGLITNVNHHRIHGRDYLMAIRKDGLVYLMNRRGELAKNFPLDLNASLHGDYFLDIGKKSNDTYFTVVSREGVRIRFNLNGKITSQEPLIKNTIDAKFSLVSEADFKTYLIVRSEQKQFSVFNENLNEIITSDFIGNSNVDVKYYTFGNGRDYIVITDLAQQLSFVYDENGKLLTPIPLDSNSLLLQPMDDGKLKVFYSQGKNLTISILP